LLKAGKTYVATITAIDQPHDPNRPFRSGLPIYSADAMTNTFTPWPARNGGPSRLDSSPLKSFLSSAKERMESIDEVRSRCGR
jgi:hypothetical protein